MLDKDYIKVLPDYVRNSLHYAKILAKKHNISRPMARNIIIHGWRRILRLMRDGKAEFHISKFGHIYPKKRQHKLKPCKKKKKKN